MSDSTLHHSATFTWPPTASDRVVVTGTFDGWSGNTHVLTKDPKTGYFSTTVPIKYGDKVAYKYVVDGQWMTREDEAKEWDSAGNMNNVYTAPHAPKPSEPVASAAVPAVQPSQAAPSRQSIDRETAPVASTQASTQVPPSAMTTATTGPQDSTTDTSTTAHPEKKHGLAGLAATAASAVGIKKASHEHEHSKDTSARSVGNDVSHATAKETPVARSTGDDLPRATAPAVAAEAKEISATRSPNALSNANSVPASSSTLTSTNAQVTPRHVTNDVPAAAATAHTSHSATTTSTSLAGLSLGAPIGGAAVSHFDSPAPTTTSYGTAADTTFTSTSALGEDKRKSIVPTSTTTTGHNDSVNKHHTAELEKREETAVAPKTEGPKTSIPQPAVVVPGSATDKTNTSSTVPSAADYPETFGKSSSLSDETAAAPKDVGPKTTIPQPDVSAASVSPVTTRAPVTANIATPSGGKAGVDLGNKTSGIDLEHTLTEAVENVAHTAQEVGTSAIAALSAAASGLVLGVGDAVHAVTGVDIVHRDPISVEEAKSTGISTKDLPNLGAGQSSTVSAGNLANSLTSVVPAAQDTATQISSTARDTAGQFSSSAKDTASHFNSSSARNLTSTSGFSTQAPAAPAVPAKTTSPVVSSYTDIPLPPAKDGLPAPVDDADIQAAKSVPHSSITPTALHPTAPRISAPVHGSMAGSAGPTSGSAVNKANTNAATGSSPSAPKQPDVFSSNQHDKPATLAGEKRAEYKTDLPAQHETKNTNHKSVPMPVITSIGDNTKDRTQPSLADNASKEVSSNPAVDTHQAKAEAHAGLNNNIDGVPSRSYAKKSPVGDNAHGTALPLATTQKPVNELPSATAPVAAAPVAAAPATPVKPAVVAVPAGAPQTPASKLAVTSEAQASPASVGSSTGGNMEKKKKGSFISKMKNVFHKDKSAK